MSIKITNLNVKWNNNGFLWKENLNLSLNPGDIGLIIGPSGCGKSCVLNSILKLIPSEKIHGNIQLFDNYDFLLTNNALEEKQTLDYNLARYYDIFYKGLDMSDLRLYISLNEKVNWTDIVNTFSFGTKRRIALYRTLFSPGPIYFLDEPTTGFDAENTSKIKKLILQMQKVKKTFLIITHEPDLADIATKVIFLNETNAQVAHKEAVGFIKLNKSELNLVQKYVQSLNLEATLAFKYVQSNTIIFKVKTKNDLDLLKTYFKVDANSTYWKEAEDNLFETVNFFSKLQLEPV